MIGECCCDLKGSMSTRELSQFCSFGTNLHSISVFFCRTIQVSLYIVKFKPVVSVGDDRFLDNLKLLMV